MHKVEYEDWKAGQREVSTYINVREIGSTERTLLYGYTCDRHDWHVYLRGGMIHFLEVQYSKPKRPINASAGGGIDARSAVPDKRVYPESTDFVFALALRNKGINIPFLPFEEARYEALKDYPFHGPILMGGVPVWDRENGIVNIWGKENRI